MACTSVANSIVDLIVLIYSRIHYVQPNKIVDGLLFLGRSPNGVIKINRPSMLPMSNSCPLARSQVKSLEETLKSEKGPSCFFGATRNEWTPWGVKHHWARVIVFFGVMWVENERGFFGALFGSTVDGPNQVLRNKQPTIYSIYHVFFSGQKMGGDIFAPVRSVKNWEVCVLKLTPGVTPLTGLKTLQGLEEQQRQVKNFLTRQKVGGLARWVPGNAW